MGSGFIPKPRGATPKPKGTIGPTPARNQTKTTSLSFTQEELSRRPTGFRGVGPPVKR